MSTILISAGTVGKSYSLFKSQEQSSILTNYNEFISSQKEYKQRLKQKIIESDQKFHENETDTYNLISQDFNRKMKDLRNQQMIDGFSSLSDYLNLQNLELKKIKTNKKSPAIEQLSKQINKIGDSRYNSSSKNLGKRRAMTELKNKSISDVKSQLSGKAERYLLKVSFDGKQKINSQLEYIEQNKFRIQTSHNTLQNTITENTKDQLEYFLPLRTKSKVKLNMISQVKKNQTVHDDKVPFTMATLKEQFLSGENNNNIVKSSINPMSLQLYSVTDKILQYHESKQKQNQLINTNVQKSDQNRRSTLFQKHLLYNRDDAVFSTQGRKTIQKELNRSLYDRLNLNSGLIQGMNQIINKLKNEFIDVSLADQDFLDDIRSLILKGRMLDEVDLQYLADERTQKPDKKIIQLLNDMLFSIK